MRKQRPESVYEPLRDVAARLGLNESSVRRGLGGTEWLQQYKVRQGVLIFFIRARVEEFIELKSRAAQSQYQKAEQHVWPH